MSRRPGRRRSAMDRGPHRALAAIGGVPRLVVPDNAKVAVIKACLYEPQVNRTYAEMAAHYGTAVLPTRPRRPRDKAKVEACVLIVEHWLIGRLRDRRFYSLAELNAAIGELLKRLNEERPIRRLGVTRRQLLEELDRPALKPLPTEPYVFAEWRVRRVGIDYHVKARRGQLDRRAREPDPVRADRRRQELARLGARPQSMSRQSLGALPAHSQAVRRPRPCPRRWPLCPHPAGARRRAVAHPRRLGSRAARCHRSSRPARDSRRTLRPQIDDHHQPNPRRQMARADRRPHLCRRHPGSHRPQRAPDQSHWPQPATIARHQAIQGVVARRPLARYGATWRARSLAACSPTAPPD